jgi:hypothetical protein
MNDRSPTLVNWKLYRVSRVTNSRPRRFLCESDEKSLCQVSITFLICSRERNRMMAKGPWRVTVGTKPL